MTAKTWPELGIELYDHLTSRNSEITYEFENVPCDALKDIEKITPVYPPLNALKHSQDRFAISIKQWRLPDSSSIYKNKSGP